MVNKILIIDCGSTKVPFICNIVKTFGAEYKLVKMLNFSSENWHNYKGIIISGAPVLITQSNIKELLKPFQHLKQCNIPILGICFGHQIIGLLHGAEIFLGKEIRTQTIVELLENSPLFTGINAKFIEVSEDHTEGITLPHDFILLAKSEYYLNEAMQHKTKKIFGVQFHPETSSNTAKSVVTNFLRICFN